MLNASFLSLPMHLLHASTYMYMFILFTNTKFKFPPQDL